MRTIRLAFCDFPGPTNPRLIAALLSRRWQLELVDDHPDYVIYSVTGNDFLQHEGAIRIFFTGENIHPDFNLCDYAFSYDWLEFGDRHFRTPNFVLFDEWRDLTRRGSSQLTKLDGKHAFCNFIYTNGEAQPRRDRFFRALHSVQAVESLGSHLRNSTRPIGRAYEGDWAKTKVAVQKLFKFTIAFENSSTPGYTTEKLVHALAADTIPIYFGDPLVGLVFNLDRMINLNRIGDEEAIERVQALHRNDSAYLEMVNRPFFSDSRVVAALSDDALLDAFAAIFSRDQREAVRRNPYVWGRMYEDRRRFEVRAARFFERLARLRFWKRPGRRVSSTVN